MGLTNQSTGKAAIDGGIYIKKREKTDKIIALAGNPNVGKSTVFNGLTGLRQHTGNWPGKTVASAVGETERNGKRYILVDLPGCYSLTAQSAEEEVARDFIKSEQADAVIAVCDATSLERNLILVLEILRLTDKVVVCVNLLDEAGKKHIQIDLKKLEALLGVPVVGTAARQKEGIERLLEAVEGIKKQEEKRFGEDIVQEAERICRAVSKMPEKDPMARDRKLDKIISGQWMAFPVMFLMLLGVFWLTIWGANYPSELLSRLFTSMEGVLRQSLSAAPAWISGLLCDGIWRVTATVVSVMLPPMAIFFPLFTLLEDAGVLPRIAFNLDRCFKKCHACGKQALTICMGFGCNAAGVVGCRIMDSPRERIIAILTNSLTPCNGRFPTLIAILSMFFAAGAAGAAFGLCALVTLSVIGTLFLSFLLSKTMLKGTPSSFVLELPPYRSPRVGHVIVRSLLDRTIFVLGRALMSAAPAGLLIWCMANITIGGATILAHCTAILNPVATFIGLDGVILMAFILGLPANEMVMPIIIMAYLSGGTITEMGDLFHLKRLLVANGWTHLTALCTLLFTLFHWPCATTLMTVHKETKSIKYTLAAALLPTALGVILCAAITFLSRWI